MTRQEMSVRMCVRMCAIQTGVMYAIKSGQYVCVLCVWLCVFVCVCGYSITLAGWR